MKISHFPDFLPDETMYSVACRYLDRMQFHSHSVVSQHFFGGNRVGAATDLPSNLEHLVQALPPNHEYTADTIINRHTLFPLYAPFLPFDRTLTLQQRMKAGGIALHYIAGIVGSKVSRPQWLRYCPACIEYDRITYGECYWHRIHQIPGISVCSIHELMLEDSTANLLVKNRIAQYCSAERSVNNLQQRMVPTHLRVALVQLAHNAKWLLEHPISVEQGYIQQRYLELLERRDLATVTGQTRYIRLKAAVLDHYPAPLLEDLGCDIAQSKENWLANWTTMQHPLHHLLFIQFLCQTPQELFTKSRPPSPPFDNGPWPCLNPVCVHYRERIITSYTIKQGYLNHPIATFVCLCGFTYCRTGPDTDDAAIFRIGKILQYGNVWDQYLVNHWLDKNISTFQVARLMHTDVPTIRRQAARLGLPFAPDFPIRGKRPKIYQDFIEDQRDMYRTMWEQALKNHPNVGITEVAKGAYKAHSWLKRNDVDWLKEHYPTTLLSSKNERLVLHKTQIMQHDYSRVDADLASAVRETAKGIYTRTDFPIQITRRLLSTQIGDPVLLKIPSITSDVLPLTLQALEETVETSTAFIWRKLRWAVQSYLAEQDFPDFYTFLSRSRIGASTSVRPIIKQLIKIAYESLRTGTLLDADMPKVSSDKDKSASHSKENFQAITSGSLADICIGQIILWDEAAHQAQKVYDILSIMLLTVAAVVSGAETCSTIAYWGYQNKELLCWFGLPEGQFPTHTALKIIYGKVKIDSFEKILETWLCNTFPQVQNKIDKTEAHTKVIRVPGIWLLRSYRHIASEVIAKLR